MACDLDPMRLKLVRDNCARLGVTCVELRGSQCEATQTKESERSQRLPASAAPDEKFDRILVDAPCSNTGVMRRRVDLRWRIRAPEILRLQRTQLDLLAQAAMQLKPGGVLIYSTCSLEPEENSEVASQFLAAHPNFKLDTERQLTPFAAGVDGAYVARLKN